VALAPGPGRVLPVCRIPVARSRIPTHTHFGLDFQTGGRRSRLAFGTKSMATRDRMSRVICQKRNLPTLFRGDEVFPAPRCNSNSVIPSQSSTSGGELLRLCSVVRWPVYSFPIRCTDGLVHGVARSALPSRRLHSGALYTPLRYFFLVFFGKIYARVVQHESAPGGSGSGLRPSRRRFLRFFGDLPKP
jgi:hypothetical protein